MQKILVLLAVLFVFSSSYALTAPSDLTFSNVLPGGFSEKILEVNSSTPTQINLAMAGPVADWLSVSPPQGYADSDYPFKIKVTVMPSADALPGTYTAYIVADQPNDNGATTYIGPAMTTKILIEITQKQIIQAQVNNIEVFEQDGKIVGLAEVENTGNLNITPKLSLELQDAQLSADANNIEILPSKSADIKAEISNTQGLTQNVCSVIASVYVGNELIRQESIPVSLGKSSEGKLQSLQVSSLEVGKPAIITAVFENTGSNDVLAQLKADVNTNGESEDVESETIVVTAGQTANLTTYFTTSAPGTYIISGYVVFDKSATTEQQITAEAQAAVPLSLGIIPLLLFAGVAVVLYCYTKRFKAKMRFSPKRRK
jgi:hypothetical protein